MSTRQVRGLIAVGVLVYIATILGYMLTDSAPGATSQVRTLYACVGSDGHTGPLLAYTPKCAGGQVVHWSVKP